MNQTRLKKIGSVALGALAVICLTCAIDAKACSLPNGLGLKSVYIPDSSALLRAFLPPANSAPDAQTSSAPRQRNGPASIVGLWQVTYSSGGTVVDMAFEVFHDDGTEMLNDITPPAQGNVCLGVWTLEGRTTYKLTHPSWTFDPIGNLAGTTMLSETVTLTSADAFTGTDTLSYFDPSGNPGPVYTGTFTGTRILPNY
jgi:hypothetical protein